jgi:hypothetical protein
MVAARGAPVDRGASGVQAGYVRGARHPVEAHKGREHRIGLRPWHSRIPPVAKDGGDRIDTFLREVRSSAEGLALRLHEKLS